MSKIFNLKIVVSLISLVALFSATADDYNLEKKVKRLKWGELEVVLLEDNRFPIFDISIYFADGALGDETPGVTEAMFSFLNLGTNRYTRDKISDTLEFFGSSYSSNVTHEYSTFSVSGLLKNLDPTLKMVCHMFTDAIFPNSELNKEKKRIMTEFKNLETDHSSLASRVFRELSLKATPYSYPTTGKIKDIKKINAESLKEQLLYFNTKVKKRIYITGPKELLNIKSYFENDCKWIGKENNYARSSRYAYNPDSNGPRIYLVNSPKANQAQIRIGRFVGKNDFRTEEKMSLSSEYLGGGFTSRLMREIRVKRGLSYGVSTFIANQKDYGRAVISTFTKTSTVDELLQVVKDTLKDINKNGIKDEDYKRAVGAVSGSFPFRFESNSSLIKQVIFYDHVGTSLSKFREFPTNVKKISSKSLVKSIDHFFNWNKQVIVIVGPKSLKETLQAYGVVKVVEPGPYL